MRFLYNIVFFVFALFYTPVFFWKGKHLKGFSERFGKVPPRAREILAGKKVIWLHAVSVGEVALAVRFIDVLRQRWADARFVLTTTTTAGREVAEKIKNEEDFVLYFPIDLGPCVRSFVNGIKPRAVLIFETEIWPNLIFELSRRRIPAFILNGRISDRAFAQYRRFRSFFRNVLRRLDAIGVQDERMRGRFVQLGADSRKVRVTGNLKFDWKPPAFSDDAMRSAKEALRRSGCQWCVAGSTHEGEEDVFFDLYALWKNRHPGLRLLVAPRHLERLEAIEWSASKRNLKVKRVSSFTTAAYDGSGVVLLLDRMGSLALFYELADVVFVGGSLVPKGGHNLVEPAYYEKPILFGPFMENFAEMAEEFKKAEAAVQVRNTTELDRVLETLLTDPEKRVRMGQAAKKLVANHQGAADRNLELLAASIS